jgi:hypothetical protein
VAGANQCAQEGEDKSGKGDKPKRHFSQVRETQHCQIIERVEVILGDSAFASLLVCSRWLCRANQSPRSCRENKIRIGIMETAPEVDYFSIIEAEAEEAKNLTTSNSGRS